MPSIVRRVRILFFRMLSPATRISTELFMLLPP
jgi:hypothetical protein